MFDNFQNLREEINIRFKKPNNTLKNPKKPILEYIIIKLPKIKTRNNFESIKRKAICPI
jgi:hypothetical protein